MSFKTMAVLIHTKITQNFLSVIAISVILLSSISTGFQEGVENKILDEFYHEGRVTWDDINLQFLSSVNEPKLHTKDFHVVKVTLPSSKHYVMHISKTKGLFHSENLSTRSEELSCVYSGTITEMNPTHSNPESGLVSLSSCHHQIGLEGLILLPSNQYYIKPSWGAHDSANMPHFVKRATPNKPSISHEAFNINSEDNPFKQGQGIDTVLRVPAEDMEKLKQSQADLARTMANQKNEGATDDVQTLNEINTDLGGDTLIENEDNGSKSPLMMALANKKSPSKVKPSSQAVSSNTVKVVEIAVFCDEALWKIWQKRYPSDTKTKMDQYVLAVINNMNTLYKQPSMTDDVSFRLVHIEVQQTKPRTLKDYGGNVNKYLTAFCNYAAEKSQNGALWDHALLLTGLDLNDAGSSATAGVAWFSTMCTPSHSCSLIEGQNFGSTFITSHEIGHSLGMDHDGSGRNSACDGNSYLMSPTTGGGKTDWSKCSMSNMKQFIASGYQGWPSPKCITKKGKKSEFPIKFNSKVQPGQQFDANVQCTAECGNCSPYSTSSAPYNNMCHLLYCKDNAGGMFFTVRGSHPALEGTTCAKGKVCKLGKCA